MDLKAYYRQKRRAVFLKRLIIGAFIFAVFLLAVWGLFWAPFLRIKNIDIKNYSDEAAIKDDISRRFGSKNMFFLPANNFFLVSTAKIVDLLRTDGFGLVLVEKKFPKTLIISFPETKPWLIFCPKENCFYVNESGILADIAPKFSENPLPEIVIASASAAPRRLGENVLDESKARFLHIAFDYLKNIEAEANKIEFQEPNAADAKIFLKEGWFIYISLNSDPQKIFSDFKLLLDEKIKDGRDRLEYVDFRFGNKAFYKLKAVN